MAFFKRVQKKVNDLWYPQSVTWGKAVTTREVADELSFISTVTRGDTYAVMENLGRVLSNFMGQGRTVKIDGIGTFYYTATSTKRGVPTAEEVSASLINGVRLFGKSGVRLLPPPVLLPATIPVEPPAATTATRVRIRWADSPSLKAIDD